MRSVSCADDVPITSRLEVTHTGVGLAWSYFYGYLNIVLPGNLLPVRAIACLVSYILAVYKCNFHVHRYDLVYDFFYISAADIFWMINLFIII